MEAHAGRIEIAADREVMPTEPTPAFRVVEPNDASTANSFGFSGFSLLVLLFPPAAVPVGSSILAGGYPDARRTGFAKALPDILDVRRRRDGDVRQWRRTVQRTGGEVSGGLE